MSTKTNFKRIALVAVAALGLGVLSSVPSQATITGGVTVTTSTGNATKAKADSTTAASVTVKFLASGTTDSVTIGAVLKTNASSTAAMPNLQAYFSDTLTSNTAITSNLSLVSSDSKTVSAHSTGYAPATVVAGAAGYVSATLFLQLDTAVARSAGTYTWTVLVTPYSSGNAGTAVPADVTITVAALDSESAVVSASQSTAYLQEGNSFTAGQTADSTVAIAATPANSAGATIQVTLKNAAGGTANTAESVTVTTTKGSLGTANNANLGATSFTYQYTKGSPLNVYLYANGSSGVATISISTPTVTFPTKTVTFYGSTYKTITASLYQSVIGVGTATTAVTGLATDTSDSSYGSAIVVYAYSSDTSVISDYGTTCSYDSTLKAAKCDLTGVKAGTANITLRNKSTLAASTVASNAIAVSVSSAASAAKVVLSTDKATYAPGEMGYLYVKVQDSAGLPVPAGTYANLFATGGITVSGQLGAASDTTTAVSITTAVRTSAPLSTDPVLVYKFYAPSTGGNFTFSAKGGTTLPTAGQVAVSTPLVVTDSGASALAAVTALATTVASLKTLIVTLTNLVLKIQKKVKA